MRGLLIQRATATALIMGIFLEDEEDGPFTIEQNVIPSAGPIALGIFGAGIWVDGDGTNAITASVTRNTVGSSGSPTDTGIFVGQVPSANDVTVERNRVDGGNYASSINGIWVEDSDGVIVRRNTVRNFVGPTGPGNAFGILIEDSSDIQVLRNVIANNDVGVVVDDDASTGETANTVVINFNNITSTVTGATGLLFVPNSAATVPLDATNNWSGAATGPSDGDTDTTDCPETTVPGCTTPPAAEGGGLRIAGTIGNANTDCGTTPGTVTTCPFRTAPVSPGGA